MVAQTTMRVAGENTLPLPKKIGFTVTSLTGARCPQGKDRVYLWDSKTPGLALMVTSNGHKSFYFVRKMNGTKKRINLGDLGEITIDQARKEVQKHNGEIARGGDPFATRKAVSKSSTLQELWDRWKEEHAKPRLRERTLVTDESRFDTCFEDWKSRRIASITESDVRNKHTQLGKERGHTTANRAVQLLRRLFYFARIDTNPAAKKCVNLYREKKRERFIEPSEMKAFLDALDDVADQKMQDLFWMLLFTAQRRENVQAMRWDQIDLDAGTWAVPGDQMKGHAPIVVPLVGLAMEILRARRAEAEKDAEYVFPSHGKRGHVVELKGAWASLLKRSGLDDLHPHDLRRTCASYMAMNGITESVIAKGLGHRTVSVTGIYARLSINEVRNAFDVAKKAMLTAGGTCIYPEVKR